MNFNLFIFFRLKAGIGPFKPRSFRIQRPQEFSMMERLLGKKVLYLLPGAKNYVENFSDRPMPLYPYGHGGLA